MHMLVALRRLHYAGRAYLPGETVAVRTAQDARLLVAIRAAEHVPSVADAAPLAEPPTQAAPAPRRRVYTRRDLRAEGSGVVDMSHAMAEGAARRMPADAPMATWSDEDRG